LFSCEDKETEDISTVTPVPHLELLGDNPMVVIKGDEFVDPGIYAEEYTVDGDTIKDKEYRSLNGVNANVSGAYKVTYEVENQEGVPFYISRTVSVVQGFDVFEIPEGTYTGYREGYGEVAQGIVIEKNNTGIYNISDLLAGFYEQYYAYGPAFVAPGLLVINEAGYIRSELGYTDGFGTSVTASKIEFSPETSTISYTVTLDAYDFSFNVWLELD
jgi:hypothetical protein